MAPVFFCFGFLVCALWPLLGCCVCGCCGGAGLLVSMALAMSAALMAKPKTSVVASKRIWRMRASRLLRLSINTGAAHFIPTGVAAHYRKFTSVNGGYDRASARIQGRGRKRGGKDG